MIVEYNGITLELLEIHGYDRRNVYTPDGAELLFVRHHLNMTCVLSPGGAPHGIAIDHLSPQQANELHPERRKSGFRGRTPDDMSVIQATGPSLRAPNGGMVEHTGVTDRFVVPALLTPRRKLVIYGYRPKLLELGEPVGEGAEKFVWLQSPREGLTIDSMNGPHPLGCTLAEPSGDAPSSGVLNFQIETHLPLAETDAARAILSHRWTTSVSHDDDYYATRTVSGEVVFDPSLLDYYSQSADSFLSQLYHPIPLGYRRSLPEVTLASDNTKLMYVFSDTAVPIVFDGGESGATRCFIEEEWKYISPRGVSGSDLVPDVGVGQIIGDFIFGRGPR